MDQITTQSTAGTKKVRPRRRPKPPTQPPLKATQEVTPKQNPGTVIEATAPPQVPSQARSQSTPKPNGKPIKPHAEASTNRQPRQPSSNAWLKQNVGLQLTTIPRTSLQSDPSPITSTAEHVTLCSYNWHDSAIPTIYVPGGPPRWHPPTLPVTLPEDQGGRYIDQNAHRVPMYTFEPMFQAMTVTNPDHHLGDVDLVANRNSMRKLLDFVTGRVDQSFRIDLDMVNDTLFFTRRERRTRENKYPGQTNLGFGHNFERRFTTTEKGLEDSTSHHRVARYMIGDLDCVIRYEVDAWLPTDNDRDADGSEKNNPQSSNTLKRNENNDETLLESLQNLSLTTHPTHQPAPNPNQNRKPNPNSNPEQTPNRKGTQIIHRGAHDSAVKLAELKAKARRPKMSDLVPQLWFGRIPYLIVGMHDKGQFHEVTVTDTADAFRHFETASQDKLRRMVDLIKTLRREVSGSKDRSCVVVCDHKVKPLKLDVYSVLVKKPILPEEFIERHWGSEASRDLKLPTRPESSS